MCIPHLFSIIAIMKNSIIVFVILTTTVLLLWRPWTRSTEEISEPGSIALWGNPFDGADTTVRFFPDQNAVYWKYTQAVGLIDNETGILISGKLPAARYMSINVYNDATMDPLESLVDKDILVESNGTYEVLISQGSTLSSYPNQLRIPEEVSKFSIILRHYLQGERSLNATPLPALSLIDLQTGNEIPIPGSLTSKPSLLPILRKLRNTPALSGTEQGLSIRDRIRTRLMNAFFQVQSQEEVLHFFNFSASGLYANKDNQYLTLPFSKSEDEAIVIRFKSPAYARDKKETTDVRYWSISLGNDETKTVQTLADYELTVHEDGFHYVVLDHSNSNILTPHGQLKTPKEMERGLIIYRNMLTNEHYEFNFNRVPVFSYDKETKEQSASQFLGEYAPVGIRVSKERLMKTQALESLFP